MTAADPGGVGAGAFLAGPTGPFVVALGLTVVGGLTGGRAVDCFGFWLDVEDVVARGF
jgi:hypothetical protein